MTSKISFSNLRRENTKHRIGMISLVLLGFLGYMIFFIMSVQNAIYFEGSDPSEVFREVTALSQPDTTIGMFVVIAGILLAISGFHYLHVKTEVDFYHALPVKRKDNLRVILLNDSILFFLFLVVAMVLRCMIASVAGCFGKEFFIHTMACIVCYFAVFLVAYLLMLLAMLLTGNTFTALLGCGVLSVYFPMVVRNLYPTLAQAFFKTYSLDSQWGESFFYLSPISSALEMLNDYETWTFERHWSYFAAVIVWIFVLLVADYLLFEIRPSEMAGKAMAFPKTKPVIRIMIVVPMAIYTGMFLYALSISVRKEWIIIGTILGAVLFHGVIECIYRFDVRGLWAYKKQMLLSMCASLLIIGFFWADLGGYDAYLPKESEVESVLINLPMMGDSYWGKDRKGISGEDLSGVLLVLDNAVKKNPENYQKANDDTQGAYDTYGIVYRLKNGKEKKRYYVMDADTQDQLMSCVFDKEQYRKDTFSLYTADWSWVTGVTLCYPIENQELDITKEQRAELFRYYLEDFSKLDYASLKEILPCGQLLIEYQTPEDKYGGMIDYYNIYPNFKKTISYLTDELHIDMTTSMKEVDLTKIEITDYNSDTDEEETYVVTDQEVINSLKEQLCYGEGYYNAAGVIRPTDPIIYSVWATVEGKGVLTETSFYTTKEVYQKLIKSGKKQ